MTIDTNVIRNLHAMVTGGPTVEEIDAGARYLRETQQAGKNLTPWADTPKATKRKWQRLAEGFLKAVRAAA